MGLENPGWTPRLAALPRETERVGREQQSRTELLAEILLCVIRVVETVPIAAFSGQCIFPQNET